MNGSGQIWRTLDAELEGTPPPASFIAEQGQLKWSFQIRQEVVHGIHDATCPNWHDRDVTF